MKKYLNWFSQAAGKLTERVHELAENVRSSITRNAGKLTETQWLAEATRWASMMAGRLAAAVKKPPEVKNVLLHTYFTSLLCLVLCVGMFLGTSYAWFTSEVNNTANEIYIGILDVELEKQNGENWNSLSATADGVNTNSLFDGKIRWEPGYTALETVRVVNEGNLAFKYVLGFTEGAVEAGDTVEEENVLELETVAAYFDVWVYDHAQDETTPYTAPTAYTDITGEDSGWTYAGSLDRILAGKNVLEGAMEAPPAAEETGTSPERTGDTYTIALHMKNATDAAVMGHKISLNVKLIAYQATGETDAFGTGNYDDGITAVSELEKLREALAADGTNILLAADMEIEEAAQCLTMTGGILDGYSKTIRFTAEKADGAPTVGVLTAEGGILRNLTIEGGEAGRALYITKLTGDLEVSNCTLSGDWAFSLSGTEAAEFTMTFVNTRFDARVAYANIMELAAFSDCTFAKTLMPRGDTTLTNCTFAEAGLDVSGLEAGETVTLINCTYSGTLVDQAVLTAAEDGTVSIVCESGVITVTDEEMVILSDNR